MYGSAQRQLDLAHMLSPDDEEIARTWRSSHAVRLTPEQRLVRLRPRLENATLNDEERNGIEEAIKGIETQEKGSCELVTPAAEAKLPIVPMPEGVPPGGVYGAELEVQFNGKKKRLEIDTGASGLLLSRSVAKSAGLVSELEIKTGGIGDSGLANAFVTHVDDIRIGSMEFKNCMVRVLERSGVLDIDGVIGPDVFRDYLVTLDIPGRELRIGPLPKRPDEPTRASTSLDTSGDEVAVVSWADRAKDRYIAPEMKDWTPVFRSDHFLIFPTVLGKAPTKLFVMDTGSAVSSIAPEAAREVTRVANDFNTTMSGVSGEVHNLLVADKVSLAFDGIRQMTEGMQAFDSTALSRSSGVDISGLIGFPTLRELVISTDYRDNLVHVVYNPKKGLHAQ
jgi:hypothetical protein